VATLRREGNELVVKLNDLERLGALHGDVRVAADAVREIRVTERPLRDVHGLRVPGTGLPGVIALGTFRGGAGGRTFAAVYRGSPGVVVELQGAQFDRLVISTHDAARIVESLRDDLPASVT
jgi:hypothetical protein